MFIFGWILRLLGGGGLSTIAGRIADAYATKQNATTEQARIAADEEIKTLQAQRDVLVQESASGGFQSWIRPLFALPFVIYNAKLVLWDKVLAWGTTDPLSDELFRIEMIVIGAYFITRSAERITRTIKR